MKHCNHCKVDVNTDKQYCPLCYSELDGTQHEDLIYVTREKYKRANSTMSTTERIK